MKKIVIGIDVGISTTKIVGIDESGVVVSPIRIKATDPITSLYGAFGKYLHDNKIALSDVEQVMLTGVGSAYIDEPIYELPTSKSEEFVADGLGARYESKLDRMIVVSMGTGTSLVKCDDNEIRHIGGIGIGGGTLAGLSRIMLKTDNIVIVDETYVEFAPAGSSCLPLLEKYDNLVITHTFSKTHNLAGARLGFCIARPALIADMNRVKFSYSPYNVNAMTQAAGAAAISDEDYFADVTAKIIAERTHTTDELRRRGFTVFDSATNFLFATTDRMPCVEIFEKLRARGILIRHFNAPRISDYLRITIGTPEQMQRFFAALDEILGE